MFVRFIANVRFVSLCNILDPQLARHLTFEEFFIQELQRQFSEADSGRFCTTYTFCLRRKRNSRLLLYYLHLHEIVSKMIHLIAKIGFFCLFCISLAVAGSTQSTVKQYRFPGVGSHHFSWVLFFFFSIPNGESYHVERDFCVGRQHQIIHKSCQGIGQKGQY